MKKIIILNGPPRSGKDTAAEEIERVFDAVHLKLSWPLKYIVSDTLGLSREELEANKERKTVYDLSYRQLQIEVYNALKRIFGDTWLASMTITRIDRAQSNDTFVLSDCGRQEEVDAMVSAFGKNNVLVLKVYRQDTSFKNDIRGYVQASSRCAVRHVDNKKDIPTYLRDVKIAVGEFLGE
jgi:adenylate kinase family enzyme